MYMFNFKHETCISNGLILLILGEVEIIFFVLNNDLYNIYELMYFFVFKVEGGGGGTKDEESVCYPHTMGPCTPTLENG